MGEKWEHGSVGAREQGGEEKVGLKRAISLAEAESSWGQKGASEVRRLGTGLGLAWDPNPVAQSFLRASRPSPRRAHHFNKCYRNLPFMAVLAGLDWAGLGSPDGACRRRAVLQCTSVWSGTSDLCEVLTNKGPQGDRSPVNSTE